MRRAVSILVVDDQWEILENLRLVLESEGFEVWTASDGIDALALLEKQRVDLLLADIAMPRMNGYQLYERVRANPAWLSIPFVFLTARSMDSDVRYGKEMGVDDYLTKPIEPEDLLSAIQGKLRRAQQLELLAAQPMVAGNTEMPVLVAGRLRVDSALHQVWLGDKVVRLSAREFTLLEYLVRRANRVVSAKELILVTHGLDTDAVEAGALLRPMIRSLRRKLGYPAGEMGCIVNVRSVGYHLVPPA